MAANPSPRTQCPLRAAAADRILKHRTPTREIRQFGAGTTARRAIMFGVGSNSAVGTTSVGGQPWLIVVSGWTGAGKSTIADLIAAEVGATVVSFDWVMSGLRAFPDVWSEVELPVEGQRRIGWTLLSRVAEQQLRRRASCVLDLVAREEPRIEWQGLAERYGARFGVVECVCSDMEVHRSRVEGRRREIPGWYELDWAHVVLGRERYVPLAKPKIVLDAMDGPRENLDLVKWTLVERR